MNSLEQEIRMLHRKQRREHRWLEAQLTAIRYEAYCARLDRQEVIAQAIALRMEVEK